MASVLLDTDVYSFLFKRDTRAEPYLPHLINVQPCVSFQTVAELRCWALMRNWGPARREELEQSLRRCVILPNDDMTASHWAQVTAARQAAGRPIACGDAWIAASALRHGLTLLTHNNSDFRDIPDLKLVTGA